MAEGPAETLARIHDNAEYYEMRGTTVTVYAAEDTVVEFDVKDRLAGASPRRYFNFADMAGSVYVDSASSNGEITETEPWVKLPDTIPLEVLSVDVEHDVEVAAHV